MAINTFCSHLWYTFLLHVVDKLVPHLTQKSKVLPQTHCSTDLHFRSHQPHTSWHCKTMDMGLVHHVVWLFASTTFAGTHCTYPWLKCILAAAFGKLLTMVGCTGWVDLGCWLYTEAHKPVLTTAFRFEKKIFRFDFFDSIQFSTSLPYRRIGYYRLLCCQMSTLLRHHESLSQLHKDQSINIT